MVKDRNHPHTNSSAQRNSAMRMNNDTSSPLVTRSSFVSLSNKKTLQKQTSKQGSIGAGSQKMQYDELGHLYHVTIKIQEEMESKQTTPIVPATPVANAAVINTLNLTH